MSGSGWWFTRTVLALPGIWRFDASGPWSAWQPALGLAQSIALAIELDDFGSVDEAVDEGDDAVGGTHPLRHRIAAVTGNRISFEVVDFVASVRLAAHEFRDIRGRDDHPHSEPVALEAVRHSGRFTGSPRSSVAPVITCSRKPPCFSSHHGQSPLQPPTPVCHNSAKLRLPALGLDPGRFRTSYGPAPPRRTVRRHRNPNAKTSCRHSN